MSYVLRGVGGAGSGTTPKPNKYGGRAPGRPVPGPATLPTCGRPGQAPCPGGSSSGGGGGQPVGDGSYMLDPGARLYATGDATAGGVIGTLIDVITSRPGALLISGTLAYLLYKSPAARKELWGTAKGQYHMTKARLGPKHGPAF